MEAAPRTDLSRLDFGEHLGSGGQGKVIAVTASTPHRCPIVLKQYSPYVIEQLDVAVLEEMVRLPLFLESSDREWLYEKLAWPLALVEDRGAVCGFLMCEVGASYYFGFQTQTQGIRTRLADIAFLLNHDDYVARAGLSVSERDRLELLLSLADILSRMHAFDLVIGDLSPKNLLFGLKPSPSCFVIDCDAVLLKGASVLGQVETPDWEALAGEPRATIASDSYKFGLLAIRLFARDQSIIDTSVLAELSSDLGRLAAMSLDPAPSKRPNPGAWVGALEEAKGYASTAPPVFTRPSIPKSLRADTVPDIRDQLDMGWLMRHALGPARAVRSSARSPVISL